MLIGKILTIPLFADLIRRVQEQTRLQQAAQDKTQEEDNEMVKFLAASHAKKKFELKKAQLQPILPLFRKKAETDDDKTKFITLDLKVRAGAPAGTPSYKKTMRVFNSGSPQEWIDVIHDVKDIWRQNVVTRPAD